MPHFDVIHTLAGRTRPAKVAYILKMFPCFSETLILNEIVELERGGVRLRIFSLKQPQARVSSKQTPRKSSRARG